MSELAEWSFEDGGSLQVDRLPERRGSGTFTLVVSGVVEAVAQLEKLHVDISHRTSGETAFQNRVRKGPDLCGMA